MEQVKVFTFFSSNNPRLTNILNENIKLQCINITMIIPGVLDEASASFALNQLLLVLKYL